MHNPSPSLLAGTLAFLFLQLQETEEQYIHSERRTYDLRSALDAKEHEASMASQKLQDLLVASSGTSNAVKQLEEHIQR